MGIRGDIKQWDAHKNLKPSFWCTWLSPPPTSKLGSVSASPCPPAPRPGTETLKNKSFFTSLWSPDVYWYQHPHFIFKFVPGPLEKPPKEREDRGEHHIGPSYPYTPTSALDVITKIPQIAWLINYRDLFLMMVEAETSKIKRLVTACFLVHRWTFSHRVLIWQKGHTSFPPCLHMAERA